MKKTSIFAIATIVSLVYSHARTYDVKEFGYTGPIPVRNIAVFGDTTQTYENLTPYDYEVSFKTPVSTSFSLIDDVPKNSETKAMHILTFSIDSHDYTDATIRVIGIDDYNVYVDGKKQRIDVPLKPGTHDVQIRYISQPNDTDDVDVSVDNEPVETNDSIIDTDIAKVKIEVVADSDELQVSAPVTHRLTLDEIIYGKRVKGVSISPSGNYLYVTQSDCKKGKNAASRNYLYNLKTGQKQLLSTSIVWDDDEDAYYVAEYLENDDLKILKTNASNGSTTVYADNIPSEAKIVFSHNDDFMFLELTEDGPVEDKDIYRIIEPEDRQYGWRDRSYPAIMPLDGKGIVQPLAMSKNNITISDISDKSDKVLLNISMRRLTKRPTTLFTIVSLDLETMKVDTIVNADGFVSEACYSPKGDKVLVTASPEAFGRVGCVLPDSVVPSTYDYQLYIIDIADKSIKPLTRDFDPSVMRAKWSKYDGKIYIQAYDKDLISLFSLDPESLKIQKLNLPETVIKNFSLSANSPMLAFYGQDGSYADRAYVYNTKTGKSTLVDDPMAETLGATRYGKIYDYTFKNRKGETVYGSYCLPDGFDRSKKYPLIVYYYGGCSPSTRLFDSNYPMLLYAEQGYVTLTIQPSGAIGFGQEWSSRHVSTAGKGVAEDIIDGTLSFCDENAFIDPDKIGCIGASYGGFMTQYLQTLTDIFAVAVSHAGISDHTSYWGEGYWGYSYSETSMGYDQPWSNPDLYVKQSPLYNADKIKTPILFLHGDVDTNVPVGESIQMFTALKLLGVETALVQVRGQNHHIVDLSKKEKWQDTIFAWLARFLKDDDTWWETLYPTEQL